MFVQGLVRIMKKVRRLSGLCLTIAISDAEQGVIQILAGAVPETTATHELLTEYIGMYSLKKT